MKLFVLGGTGRTGREVIDLALARKHHVTAFVRSPQKLTPSARLSIVHGDPRSTDALRDALPSHDAVISVLGAPPKQALRPSTIMADFAASTVGAMTRAGIPRLAILSAAVLFPEKGITAGFFRWLLRYHAVDLGTMETIVTASDLAWTIARPPRLVHERSEVYRSTSGALPPGSRTVSFRAVAAFMLDAIEKRDHVHEIHGVVR